MTSLGIQLYSVRDDIGPDRLDGTLARLAALGFTHAEPYDIVTDPQALADALRRNGLLAATAHAKVTELDETRVLDAAELLGVGTVIVPWVAPETFENEAAVQRLATAINGVADRAARRGIRIGYHNHDFEFARRIGDEPGYEVFVRLLDPAVVLELDVYWASVGGADVFELLPRLGDRVRFLHVVNEREPGNDRPVLGTPIAGRLPEIVELAPSVELPIVEVVAHHSDVFPLVRSNARFFTGLVRA